MDLRLNPLVLDAPRSAQKQFARGVSAPLARLSFILCTAMAVVLAMTAALPLRAEKRNVLPGSDDDRYRGGEVRWARLRHSGGFWLRHVGGDNALISFVRATTTLNVDSVWHCAAAGDLDQLTEYPLLFVDTLEHLKPPEVQNVAEYVKRGGFLFIDGCVNKKVNATEPEFSAKQISALKTMFPSVRLEPVGLDHELFSIYFTFEKFPPVKMWVGDTDLPPPHLIQTIHVDDRVVGVLAVCGIRCGWAGVNRTPIPYMKMMTNIYLYALTR